MSKLFQLDNIICNVTYPVFSGLTYILKSDDKICVAFRDGYIQYAFSDSDPNNPNAGRCMTTFVGLFDTVFDLNQHVNELWGVYGK